MRMVDLIRSQQKEQKEKSATPRPKEPGPDKGGQEPELDTSEETSGLQEDASKAVQEDAAPLPEAPRIVAMVDLIRSRQKAKSATPRPKELAPSKGGQELELDTSGETSGLRENTWKARLQEAPPLPEEPSIFAPGHADRSDELYAAAEDILRAMYTCASRREPFAIEPAAQMAERLAKAAVRESLQRAIKDSLPRPSTLMQQTLSGRGPEKKLNLARRGLNVAIIALNLGEAMGYSVTKLTQLALAGMFHDIGLTWLPEAILHKSEPLSKSEREQIEKHPLNGWEIIGLLGRDWEWLANVTLQHHEREDGAGYPNGLGGDQIHEYAKIIGICDIYEAMAHGRPGRDEFTPIDALKEILQTERGGFSQTILRAFINGLSSYPVGSWVRLSSKEVGQVVSTNKDNPLRPVLEVWYDAAGTKLAQPKVIDLNKEILLHITGPASEGARTG